VFGTREIGERETQARERGKKCGLSPVWCTREVGEIDKNSMGPTCFFFFADMRRKKEEKHSFYVIPILSLFLCYLKTQLCHISKVQSILIKYSTLFIKRTRKLNRYNGET
jgi:hypothetical protein